MFDVILNIVNGMHENELEMIAKRAVVLTWCLSGSWNDNFSFWRVMVLIRKILGQYALIFC